MVKENWQIIKEYQNIMEMFVDTRKILIFNNLYIIHDNFEKRMQDVSNFTTRDHLIDWLFSYD